MTHSIFECRWCPKVIEHQDHHRVLALAVSHAWDQHKAKLALTTIRFHLEKAVLA